MSGDQRRPSQPVRGRVPLDTFDSFETLRPSSLPPELGDLDFKWDDDLSSPAGPRSAGQSTTKLELDLELDEGDRPTAVPSIPMDQFVAQAMAEVDLRERERSELPSAPPFDMRSHPPEGGSGSAGGDSAYPPTLPSNRMVITPMPDARSVLHAPLDPLSVDLAEMDIVRPETYLSPTEPPDELLAQRPTIAPTEAARARQNSAAAASANPVATGQTLARTTMKDRYAMGDFTSALEIAESLLVSDSADLEAQRYATSCRDVLTQMYLSRLGGLEQIINVVLPPEELRWLNLDHRAGFLLSLVDGVSTIEELLDISGMPRIDALRILATLREQRAILLGSR